MLSKRPPEYWLQGPQPFLMPHPTNLPLLGKGTQRWVYDMGVYVLKVPLDEAGLMANDREANTFKRWKNRPDLDGCYYARCHLWKNGWLLMEKITPLKEDPPEWADWIDCHQVGQTRHGKVVAYDFG